MTHEPSQIPAAIRALLACPKCRGPLLDSVLPRTDGAQGAQPDAVALVCTACGLAYPVEEGIPVLLVERATSSRPVV